MATPEGVEGEGRVGEGQGERKQGRRGREGGVTRNDKYRENIARALY